MPNIAASELNSQYYEPSAIGPLAQVDLTTWLGLSPSGPPAATIPNASSYVSGVIVADGFKVIGVAVKSSNTGVITIQRYMDKLGLAPVGAPVTANLVANTANSVNIGNDGVPFQSFTFSISNTGAGVATLSNFCCLLTAG